MDLDELADAMNEADGKFGFGYRLVRASELHSNNWLSEPNSDEGVERRTQIGKLALSGSLDKVLETTRQEEPERFEGLETSGRSAVLYLGCGTNMKYAEILARVVSSSYPGLRILGVERGGEEENKRRIDIFNHLASNSGINIKGVYGNVEDLDVVLKNGKCDSAGIVALFNPELFPKLEKLPKNAILIGSAAGYGDSEERYREGLAKNGFIIVAEMPNELGIYIVKSRVGIDYFNPLFVAVPRGD